MDGDLCPIKELLDAAPHVKLIVDEAHATGFYGPGLVSHLSLESRVFARIVTFGKGLGVHGACILGSDLLKQYLINYCKPVVFSTFLPRHALVSISCAYKHMIAHPELAVELRKRIDYFRERMKSFGDRLLPSVTPIQGLIVPGNHQVVKASKILQSKGLDVRPIRSPTVPKGRERLRICLHANNTYEQLD
ncbi:pyridoxal phosphate-dependent transferase, partial [Gorgonomyces haynaldii]